MPYREHQAFDTPDEERTVWRYISLPQLLSILDKESLYFTRVEEFNDPFEGELPQKNKEMLDSQDSDIEMPEYTRIDGDYKYEGSKHVRWDSYIKNKISKIKLFQKISFVNCWHLKKHETVAMWDTNIPGPEGVAIKSTVGDLRDAFDAFEENDVLIGKVNYIDYKNDAIPEDHILRPFTYKRQGFEHESELRAVVTSPPLKGYPDFVGKGQGDIIPFDWDDLDVGKYIEIDIETLIEEIRLSPNESDWHADILNSVINDMGADFSVKGSVLNATPSVFS